MTKREIEREWKFSDLARRMVLLSEVGILRLAQAGVVKFHTRAKSGHYALLDTNFGHGYPTVHYLKMRNPSTGEIHIEGLPTEFATIDEALRWRNHGWFTHADQQT
jgi:hypothetical protein